MNQTAKARMRREAKALLQEFGIPLNEYNAGEIFGGPYVWDVTFTRKSNGAEITVSEVWTDDSGEILQSGAHAGALTL